MIGDGAVVDKAIEYMVSQGIGSVEIASALLGDPKTLILDEPVNGLDPEGVLWVRNLARYLASEGRTVFLSSHHPIAAMTAVTTTIWMPTAM